MHGKVPTLILHLCFYMNKVTKIWDVGLTGPVVQMLSQRARLARFFQILNYSSKELVI